MNLVLCGMMGSGKTALGKNIAAATGRKWLDTDDVIVQRYGAISEIFATEGEEYFRGLETKVVEELSEQDGYVISTGGGLVLREKNVELLKKNGKILFLRANAETLLKRLSGDTARPLLQGQESLEEKINRLLKERTPAYERAADYTVDVDKKTPEEIGTEILSLIQKKQ